jgi:hypothetical protein
MLPSSGIYRHVVRMQTDVSKERITTIVRVEILALLIVVPEDGGETASVV